MYKLMLACVVLISGGTTWAQTNPKGSGEDEVVYKGRSLAQWIERANDGNVKARVEAIRVLGEWTWSDARIIKQLRKALRDKDGDASELAASSLANIPNAGKKVLAELIKNLKTGAERNQEAAALALGRMGTLAADRVEARAALMEALASRKEGVRRSAVIALGGLGADAKEAVPALIEMLRSEKSQVLKGAALITLGDIGSDAGEAAPAITEVLQGSAQGLAVVAADSLGRLGYRAKSAIQPLLVALKNMSNDDLRINAAFALGNVGAQAKEIIPGLLQAMKDPNNAVQINAAYALSNLGRDARQAVPALIAALEDKSNDDLRTNAALVLSNIGWEAKEAVPALIEVLKDPREDTQINAVLALGNIGSVAKEAIPALIKVLSHSDNTNVRINAALALSYSRAEAKDAVPILLNLLEEPNEELQANALIALGAIGSEARDYVPALKKYLKSTDVTLVRRVGISIGQIEPKTEGIVHILIAALEDQDETTRLSAAQVLANTGPPGEEAVPALILALKDPYENVRQNAVYAVGRLGANYAGAAIHLITAIKDRSPLVRVQAAYALALVKSSEPSKVVSALTEAIRDQNQEVRTAAIGALGFHGRDAKASVPALVLALKDPSPLVRQFTAASLGSLGPMAKDAVPAMVQVLKDTEPLVRRYTAVALGQMGQDAKKAIPGLIHALKDPDVSVREESALALNRLGPDPKSALTPLTEAINDEDATVRLHSVATVLRMSLSDVNELPPLVEARKNLENRAAIENEEEIRLLLVAAVKRLSDTITAIEKKVRDQKLQVVFNWLVDKPWLWVPACCSVVLLMFWCFLLRFRPLALLNINRKLDALTITIPKTDVKISFSALVLAGAFCYRPRVLAAWVQEHIGAARQNFQERLKVQESERLVPLPLVLDGEALPGLVVDNVKSKFAGKRVCLLIWGEGGVGKTTLACQIASWAMAENPTGRLSEKLMIPVFLSPGTELEEADVGLTKTIARELRFLLEESEQVSEDFLKRLLKNQYVLLVVDGLSEMSTSNQFLARPDSGALLANAVIVTSRIKESVASATAVAKPLRIAGDHLSTFIESYLNKQGKRQLFTDSEFFNACSHLTKVVDDRDVTVLLATLYSRQMIADKEGTSDDGLPTNVPDLMLQYLNELNRDASDTDLSDLALHRVAKVIAWECVKEHFLPTFATRQAIATAIGNSVDPDILLAYLTQRLSLVQFIEPGRDAVRFLLDPLAEFLAGLHLVDLYGSNAEDWRTFCERAAKVSQTSDACKALLLAIRDCCIYKGRLKSVPEFVAERLSVLAGATQGGNPHERVQQLTEQYITELQSPVGSTRSGAARALGQIGPRGNSAVGRLMEIALHDPYSYARISAIGSLGAIDPTGLAVITTLGEAVKDPNGRVRTKAAQTLGRIGGPAAGAIPALEAALQDQLELVRATATQALERIRTTLE